ncbi:MAG: ribosomal protein [Bacillota bacterium]|jgi:small subunit ribosomal protein S6
MVKYEMMLMAKPTITEENYKQLKERLTSIITDNGGELTELKELGKKRLAYQIDNFTEGLYSLFLFSAVPVVLTELERFIKINEDILRHLVLNLSEIKQQEESAPVVKTVESAS